MEEKTTDVQERMEEGEIQDQSDADMMIQATRNMMDLNREDGLAMVRGENPEVVEDACRFIQSCQEEGLSTSEAMAIVRGQGHLKLIEDDPSMLKNLFEHDKWAAEADLSTILSAFNPGASS